MIYALLVTRILLSKSCTLTSPSFARHSPIPFPRRILHGRGYPDLRLSCTFSSRYLPRSSSTFVSSNHRFQSNSHSVSGSFSSGTDDSSPSRDLFRRTSTPKWNSCRKILKHAKSFIFCIKEIKACVLPRPIFVLETHSGNCASSMLVIEIITRDFRCRGD